MAWLTCIVLAYSSLLRAPQSSHHQIVVVSPDNTMFPGLPEWRQNVKNADPDGNVTTVDQQAQAGCQDISTVEVY